MGAGFGKGRPGFSPFVQALSGLPGTFLNAGCIAALPGARFGRACQDYI